MERLFVLYVALAIAYTSPDSRIERHESTNDPLTLQRIPLVGGVSGVRGALGVVSKAEQCRPLYMRTVWNGSRQRYLVTNYASGLIYSIQIRVKSRGHSLIPK